MTKFFNGSILLLAAFAMTGCESSKTERASLPPVHAPIGSATGDPRRRFESDDLWIDDRGSGSPSVKLVLSEQRAYYYKGGKLSGMSPISTGREGNPTQTGHFRITEMDPSHKSTLYGNYVDANGKIIQADVDTSKDPKPPGAVFDGAAMLHFMRINGGTGMHEGFMPGYPDSHGCIRMPGWFAAALYDAVDVGTPVTVVR